MAGYWNSNYWQTNYWQQYYWAPTGSGLTGDFWNDDFWNVNYWNVNYWLEANDGDVSQRVTPNLALTTYNPVLNIGTAVQATTPTLPLTTFQADANLDIDPAVTTPNLPLNTFTAAIATEGYQAGDIDTRIVPDSTFEVTYGVVASTAALPLTPQVQTIEYELGVAVAATVASLSLTPYVTDASLNIDPPLLTASLSFTTYPTTAGIGEQIPATTPGLTFGAPTHTVFGFSPAEVNVPSRPTLALNVFRPAIFGRPELFIPPGTWPADDSITNDNADEYPSNYEICDRTGFKVRRGELVREWTGAMVRADSWERRNIQDFVRGVGDEMKGSERPEQEDRFIDEEHPFGVTADDL